MPAAPRLIRVLHIIPELPVGGAETLIFHMARGLDRQRFAPAVCVLGEPGPMGQEMAAAGIEVVALRRFRRPGRWLRVLPPLTRLLRERGAGIVHTHLYHGNTYGRLAAIRARTPVIVASVHNVYERVKPHRAWINRALARWTDAILAGSEAVREDILRWDGVPRRQVHVLPYGIEPEPYLTLPDPAESRRMLGLPPDAPVIGTVGRLEIQKGHDLLLRSLADLRREGCNAVLLLVGEGRERTRLSEMAAELGLADRVRFLGTRRDLPVLFAAMDVFAFPSRWEGTPLALIAAMAAGLPVVATPVGGIPDVLKDGATGRLVPVEDVPALTAALRATLRDAATSRTLGVAARENVLNHCSVMAMLHELEALYWSLAEKAGIA
jgi:glycosyltransferase involved in cell wall biosynthesis